MEKASEANEMLTRIYPRAWGHWNDLGYNYLESGRTEKAIEPFHEAIRLYPNAYPYWGLGLAFTRLNRFDEAKEVFERFFTVEENNMREAMLFILALTLLSCISCGAHEFPDRRSSKPPEKPGALTNGVETPGPSELGNVWHTRELNAQGKGCDGVWTRRPGTNVFDARWQCVGGLVTDTVEIKSVKGNEVLVYRTSERNLYHLTLSDDKTQIVSGKIPWGPGWTFTATIEQ